jgi:hypothetical protein
MRRLLSLVGLLAFIADFGEGRCVLVAEGLLGNYQSNASPPIEKESTFIYE